MSDRKNIRRIWASYMFEDESEIQISIIGNVDTRRVVKTIKKLTEIKEAELDASQPINDSKGD